AATRIKAARTFARALEGGKHLTRLQLAAALRRARIDPDEQRLGHLLVYAEIEGLICSGPRVGKQLTYALIDERVPPTAPLEREVALTT
ncbi:DNA glycosylase AlkZ-like family protein, partial [Enterococcus casseliflavus]|uniref:DNA glycosylase AlkZ-like family protein n=1 Tax=Enterococcus casseliflavus TaxID=37734 RepID=UPI003D0F648C